MVDSGHMDDLARFNKERWEELANTGVAYSRPMLDLDTTSAWRLVDAQNVMRSSLDDVLGRDVRGRDVLCLAGGGGQQSVAFALLGANVTVVDLSETQLERDRKAAAHYGMHVTTVQADMRDLCMFEANTFDIVFQPFSINFVPDVAPVHAEVARVLRPGGLYRLQWSNPYTQTVDDTNWNGDGYLIRELYEDGRELSQLFPHWDIDLDDGSATKIESPKEFVHGLPTMVNSLVAQGFVILHAGEDTEDYAGDGSGDGSGDDGDLEPGSWPHFQAVIVPYLTLWAKLLPGFVQTQQQQG